MKIKIEDRTGVLSEFTVPESFVEDIFNGDNFSFNFGNWDNEMGCFLHAHLKRGIIEPLPINAFSCAAYGPAGDAIFQEGMTMRQYYAAKALPGLMSIFQMNPDHDAMLAERSFQIADAMIKEELK